MKLLTSLLFLFAMSFPLNSALASSCGSCGSKCECESCECDKECKCAETGECTCGDECDCAECGAE